MNLTASVICSRSRLLACIGPASMIPCRTSLVAAALARCSKLNIRMASSFYQNWMLGIPPMRFSVMTLRVVQALAPRPVQILCRSRYHLTAVRTSSSPSRMRTGNLYLFKAGSAGLVKSKQLTKQSALTSSSSFGTSLMTDLQPPDVCWLVLRGIL